MPSSQPALTRAAEPGVDEASTAPDDGDPRGLSAWVARLSERGMPVFARTVREVSGVVANSESSAAELARVVLQDPAMTARLLRVANSPYYNTVGRGISTVSRSVVLLGFDTVRSICLSIAVVDSMLKGKQKERVLHEMARSLHAAVQARAFAAKRNDRSPEEVFIATLLHQLGQMAFWSHARDQGSELDAVLRQSSADPARLEEKVLGFSLHDLSTSLGREWRLGGLLQHALEGKQGADPRVSNIVLGRELAQHAEAGWNTPEMHHLLERVAESLYMPVEEVRQMVEANAGEAAKTAGYLGASAAGRLIPQPPVAGGGRAGPPLELPDEPVADKFPQADAMLQLKILRELSALMETRPDINLLLEMVLEGIYRGIGMDRTLFALCSADRRYLRARYVLGWDKDSLQRRFTFELSPLKAMIFSHVLEMGEPMWVAASPARELAPLLTDEVQELTGGAPFFVMPIVVNGQSIGLFYADRGPSGRALDDESYTSFRHFCQQANLALSYSRQVKVRKPQHPT